MLIFFVQMVKSNKNDINIKKENIKSEVSGSDVENIAKRKHDEIEDTAGITLLDGLSEQQDNVLTKKRKKIATADKILEREQEKV